MVRHRPLGALATVAPKLVWPQRRLGLDEAQLKKVVLLNPSLLSKSIEDNLAPTLDWLQARLDLDDEQLRKMIVALPALLGYSRGQRGAEASVVTAAPRSGRGAVEKDSAFGSVSA